MILLALPMQARSAPPNYEVSETHQMASDAFGRNDLKTAIPLFRAAAEAGDSGAQMMLGGLYQWGQGAPKDYRAAHKWLSLAAEQGWGGAMNNLGLMYRRGNGVRRDNVTALKWLYLAAVNIGVDPDGSEMAMVKRNQASLIATMTTTQVTEARRKAAAWSISHERR